MLPFPEHRWTGSANSDFQEPCCGSRRDGDLSNNADGLSFRIPCDYN